MKATVKPPIQHHLTFFYDSLLYEYLMVIKLFTKNHSTSFETISTGHPNAFNLPNSTGYPNVFNLPNSTMPWNGVDWKVEYVSPEPDRNCSRSLRHKFLNSDINQVEKQIYSWMWLFPRVICFKWLARYEIEIILLTSVDIPFGQFWQLPSPSL